MGERHYGLQLGDTVRMAAFGTILDGVVVGFDATDNNCALIRLPDGRMERVVAEWCTVTARAELAG